MWGKIRFTSTGESHGKWDLVYKIFFGVGGGGGGGVRGGNSTDAMFLH